MMSRRNDKEGSGRTTESGHNDTHETVMRPHAKNGGIAANKSHDKAVILFTFPKAAHLALSATILATSRIIHT